MTEEDTPWGSEEIIMTSGIDFSGDIGLLSLRRVRIDIDEMTAYHFHRHRNELVFIQSGLVEIRMENDYTEVGSGEAHFIEAEETHQLQNVGGDVAELLEISFPFDVDDVVMVEDPYEELR